jgi:hypothetical protein
MWTFNSNALQKMQIKTKEKKSIQSCVGEWHITKNNGYGYIGKFRSNPCASGNYSWMYTNNYKCEYTEPCENNINGLITLREIITPLDI